jgi:N-carbamoylputrescine amidase
MREPEHRPITVALVQMRCAPDPAANFETACQRIRDAAAQGAQIVCLPELFRTQYFCQTENHANFALAEPVPGPSTDALARLAAELNVVIIASLFEQRARGVYHNTAAVLDANGDYLGKYRKMHIPDDPLYYEKFYFTPGDLGFRCFRTQHAPVGTLVCWDQWYPEAARITALQGAEILFYPTAIGWHPSEKAKWGEAQLNSWELIQRSHAIANGCFVVAVNRVGHEGPAGGGIEFWGRSFVAGPDGEIRARAPEDAEQIVVAKLDLGEIERRRTHWPFFRDRRVDAYRDILNVYLGDEPRDKPA